MCHPTSMENTYSPLIGVFPSMPGAQKGGGPCGSDRAFVGDASHVTSGQATFGGCSAWPFLRVLWSSWTSRSSGPFDSLPVEGPVTLWRMPLRGDVNSVPGLVPLHATTLAWYFRDCSIFFCRGQSLIFTAAATRPSSGRRADAIRKGLGWSPSFLGSATLLGSPI